jgi:MFS transporter, PAT family, beta-lactamase induction signal transducer AmpG
MRSRMLRRLSLLGSIAFGHGVAWGLVSTLVLVLTNAGLSPAQLSKIQSVIWIPWVCKPLIAPWIERMPITRFGRQKPVMVLTGVGLALSVLAIAGVSPAASLSTLIGLSVLQNVFAAVQDVSLSVVLLEQVPEVERGTSYGVVSAAKIAGVLLGGPAFMALSPRWGLTPLVWVAAASVLLPFVFVLRMHDPARVPAADGLFRSLLQAFSPRSTRIAAALALCFLAGEGLLTSITFPLYKNELHLSDDRVSFLTATATVLGAVCALLGGWASDRLGRRRVIVVATIIYALTELTFGLGRSHWSTSGFVLVYTVINAMAAGTVFAAIIPLFMSYCQPGVAATQFQVFVSLYNLRSAWTIPVGGWLAKQWPASTLFIVAAGLDVLPLLLLLVLTPRRE